MTEPSTESADSVSIDGAIEIFFGDLRLAPRTRATYRQGLRKFVHHLEQHEGIDPKTTPVTDITTDHVTSFAALLVPPDIRTPEEVSRMRTAQNNLAAVRKFCSYLSAYDLHPTISTDRLKVRIAAMMPRFTPPPPDVKQHDLETIVSFVTTGPREEKPHLELRRLKVRAMVLFMFRTGVRVSSSVPCAAGR
jgi:site-specific recombinase XerD